MKADTTNPASVAALDIAGHMLLKEQQFDLALQLLEANMKAFPDKARVYDSYAEALAWKGRLKDAAKYYKIALQKNPKHTNAREILRHL